MVRSFYGDYIGNLIVSGYMYPWSEKYMHVEVRELRDPYRVRGAFNIKIVKPKEVPSRNVICGVVKLVEKHFVLLKPLRASAFGPTPLYTDAYGE